MWRCGIVLGIGRKHKADEDASQSVILVIATTACWAHTVLDTWYQYITSYLIIGSHDARLCLHAAAAAAAVFSSDQLVDCTSSYSATVTANDVRSTTLIIDRHLIVST